MFIRALIAFLALPSVVGVIVPLLIVGGDVHPAKTAPYGIALLSIGFLLAPMVCQRLLYIRQGNACALGSTKAFGGRRSLSFFT